MKTQKDVRQRALDVSIELLDRVTEMTEPHDAERFVAAAATAAQIAGQMSYGLPHVCSHTEGSD